MHVKVTLSRPHNVSVLRIIDRTIQEVQEHITALLEDVGVEVLRYDTADGGILLLPRSVALESVIQIIESEEPVQLSEEGKERLKLRGYTG